MKKKRVAHNKGQWKSPLGHCRSRVERTCETCGGLFTAEVRKIVRGGGRFCSKLCNPNYPKAESQKTKSRRYNLKSKYGLTVAEFEDMNARQNGKCAICGDLPHWKHGVLAIDHCHTTGRVRELLCNNCNRALGWFRDSPDLLRRAISYLEFHEMLA